MIEGFLILVSILIGFGIGSVLFSTVTINNRLAIWETMGGMLFGFLLITSLVTLFLPGWGYFLLNSSQIVILILSTGITMAFKMLDKKI